MTGNHLNTPATEAGRMSQAFRRRHLWPATPRAWRVARRLTPGPSLRAGRKLDSRPEIAGPISHNAMQIK